MILDFENKTDYNIDEATISAISMVAQTALESEGVPFEAEISLMITDNDGICALNKKYRKIEAATDVLSFPSYPLSPREYGVLDAEESPVHLGDIAISIEKAERQSEECGHSLLRELAFLTVHSVLHLLGHDHLTEAESADMFKRQEEILMKTGIVRQT